MVVFIHVYYFIKPFLDKNMSIFEEYGAFKVFFFFFFILMLLFVIMFFFVKERIVYLIFRSYHVILTIVLLNLDIPCLCKQC